MQRSKRDVERLRRFGRKIMELRRKRGESRQALARLVNLHVSSISRIENGTVEPSYFTIEKLARALNVEPSALVA